MDLEDHQITTIEDSILERIIFGGEMYYDIAIEMGLKPQLFSDKLSRDLFKFCQKLGLNNEPINSVNLLEIISGTVKPGFVQKLGIIFGERACYSAEGFKKHITRLIEKKAREGAINICNVFIHKIQDSHFITKDIGKLADDISNTIQNTRRGSVEHISEGLGDIHAKIIEKNKGNRNPIDISTGFPKLDELIDGVERGKYITVGARTSIGKSLFTEAIGINVAKQGHAVMILSYEMTNKAMRKRAIAQYAEINAFKMKRGYLPRDEMNRLSKIMPELSRLPIYLSETSYNTNEMRAIIRQSIRKHNTLVFIIDFIQLVEHHKNLNIKDRMTAISHDLVRFKKEYNINIIVAAQLNRATLDQKYGRPRRHNLQESGSLEQDSDIIILLWRPIEHMKANEIEKGIYEYGETIQGDALKTYMQAIVAKQRDGECGVVPMNFNKATLTFTERETEGFHSNYDSYGGTATEKESEREPDNMFGG